MFKQLSVLQDGPIGTSGRVRDVIKSVASSTRFDRVRAAVAYASASGCRDLDIALSNANRAWKSVEKKWLLSIDFGHSDPRAIRYLKRLPKSQVRIYDGKNVLQRKLRPATTFHPKTFVFDRAGSFGPRSLGFVLGSANLTFGGLDSNIEHVVGMRFSSTIGKIEKKLFEPVSTFEEWWDLAWLTADQATTAFLLKYQGLRKKHRPQVRDRRGTTSRRKLPAPLSQLRAFARWGSAKCFWIETENMYKNRGKHAPGNQLDARRGTRVYFGFPYQDVARNTKLGPVKMKFGNRTAQSDRSIWFGNNFMDKIHLPVPGTHGPAQYDHSVVHFRRIGPREFAVSLGNRREALKWRRQSNQQGMLHRLGAGRRFGFYS
jgi:HKD family nuclease